MKMLPDFKMNQFFETDLDLRPIITSHEPLKAFPGDPESPWHRLYQLVEMAALLGNGQLEDAEKLYQLIQIDQPPLYCHKLASIWLVGETQDVEVAYAALDDLIDELQDIRQPYRLLRLLRPLENQDIKIARQWAPILRLYMISILPEIRPEHIEQSQQDVMTARTSGIPEAILSRLTFLIRISQARQLRCVDQVLAAAQEWQALCQQYPTYGNGHEYDLEAILALEFDSRFEDALKMLNTGLKSEADNYELLVVKARILKRIGRITESMEICNRLIELFPTDFSGYCLRSNAYFLLGYYDKALQDAEKACEVDPENPNCLMARAFVMMQMSRYADALADFEQTLHYDPQRYDALRGQGKCLSMLGRDFEALASFQRLRRAWPDDPDIYYELADVLFSAGYLDDCEKACRKCLQLDNTYVSAYVILGMIAMRRNDDDKARRLLTRAVAMEPDNPFALNELSYLTHLDGDDDTAIELVNRAIEESPEYADALCNKGVIHYFRSEFEQAAQTFERTLQLMPDHVGALVGKGNTLTQLSEYEPALACYDLALEFDPENVDACHGKIMLYRMLGLDAEVREWQEKAWRLEKGENPDDENDLSPDDL
jgi:tetratricopeptide (TPR) repeat protein